MKICELVLKLLGIDRYTYRQTCWYINHLRFEVLTVAKMLIVFIWLVMSFSHVQFILHLFGTLVTTYTTQTVTVNVPYIISAFLQKIRKVV
jgi:hypothetical protein